MKPLSELPPSGTWLKPEQAAHFIPFSASWLEKARKKRAGPAYFTVGRNVFYTPESLKEWTEHQIRKGSDS